MLKKFIIALTFANLNLNAAADNEKTPRIFDEAESFLKQFDGWEGRKLERYYFLITGTEPKPTKDPGEAIELAEKLKEHMSTLNKAYKRNAEGKFVVTGHVNGYYGEDGFVWYGNGVTLQPWLWTREK